METVEEKLERYLELTKEAIFKVKIKNGNSELIAKDFLDMAKRYYKDAEYFNSKGEKLNALVAVTYAHAFLDAGARAKVFDVKDSRLFMVDEE